jgi:hypothetical protein
MQQPAAPRTVPQRPRNSVRVVGKRAARREDASIAASWRSIRTCAEVRDLWVKGFLDHLDHDGAPACRCDLVSLRTVAADVALLPAVLAGRVAAAVAVYAPVSA